MRGWDERGERERKALGERNEKKRSERSLKGEVEGNEKKWFLLD